MNNKCKWIKDKDSYGVNWHCAECGKCVFYENDEPTECIKDTDAVVLPSFRKDKS